MRAVYYTQDMLVFQNQKGSAECLSPGRAYDQHLALLPSAVRLGEEPHMSIERAPGAINWEKRLVTMRCGHRARALGGHFRRILCGTLYFVAWSAPYVPCGKMFVLTPHSHGCARDDACT